MISLIKHAWLCHGKNFPKMFGKLFTNFLKYLLYEKHYIETFLLHKKCPHPELFLVRKRENTDQGISPYSVRMREKTDQKNLRIWTLFTQCLIFYFCLTFNQLAFIFILHCENHFWKWDYRKDMHRFMKMLCDLLLILATRFVRNFGASDIIIITWHYPASRPIKC